MSAARTPDAHEGTFVVTYRGETRRFAPECAFGSICYAMGSPTGSVVSVETGVEYTDGGMPPGRYTFIRGYPNVLEAWAGRMCERCASCQIM